jgi:hypothetical protein
MKEWAYELNREFSKERFKWPGNTLFNFPGFKRDANQTTLRFHFTHFLKWP